MQKIFSARLDEAVLNELERATQKLRLSKRAFLEDAIREHAAALLEAEDGDVWAETLGAWRRREQPETTIRRARRAFRETFSRRHRRSDARVHR